MEKKHKIGGKFQLISMLARSIQVDLLELDQEDNGLASYAASAICAAAEMHLLDSMLIVDPVLAGAVHYSLIHEMVDNFNPYAGTEFITIYENPQIPGCFTQKRDLVLAEGGVLVDTFEDGGGDINHLFIAPKSTLAKMRREFFKID